MGKFFPCPESLGGSGTDTEEDKATCREKLVKSSIANNLNDGILILSLYFLLHCILCDGVGVWWSDMLGQYLLK